MSWAVASSIGNLTKMLGEVVQELALIRKALAPPADPASVVGLAVASERERLIAMVREGHPEAADRLFPHPPPMSPDSDLVRLVQGLSNRLRIRIHSCGSDGYATTEELVLLARAAKESPDD